MKKDLSDNKQITYTYFHFGPFLFHTLIKPEECKILLEEGKKCRKKSNDFRHRLAGHVSEEYQITNKERIVEWLQKYLKAYALAYNKWRGRGRMSDNFSLDALWINYMKANEFNPPHDHSGNLSFVIYPDVPKKITKENQAYVGSGGTGPGGTSWNYGISGNRQCISGVHLMPKTGDLFIFPSALEHWVFPFKSKVERVSVSGNIFMDKQIYIQPKKGA